MRQQQQTDNASHAYEWEIEKSIIEQEKYEEWHGIAFDDVSVHRAPIDVFARVQRPNRMFRA